MVCYKAGETRALELENGKENQDCPSVSLAVLASGFPGCLWVRQRNRFRKKGCLGEDLHSSWRMGPERKERAQ